MVKIKTIVLTLKDKKEIGIPIWSKKAKDGLKCHIDRITHSNDVEKIKLYFFDDKTRVYKVLSTQTRKIHK